jgi:ABC-type transport system involved in multi-copper enzyme maturation permease subunit
VVLVAFLLVSVSALFGAVTIGSQIRVIKDFGLFSLSFFGAMITVICGATLLNREIKLKTVHNILSKPVARWQFIVGKNLGLCLTAGSLVCFLGIGLVTFVSLLQRSLDLLLFQGILFAILEIIIVASLSMFFSTLVVTTTLSGIFTLATYIAGRSISYLKYFLTEGESYDPVFAAIVRFFDLVLPDLSLFNHNAMIVYDKAVPLASVLHAIVYCFSYSLVTLGLAALIFEKRELV